VAAVEVRIGVDGAGVGVVDAQEVAMRLPEFPEGGLAPVGPYAVDRGALQGIRVFLDFRAGEGAGDQAETPVSLNVPGDRASDLAGNAVDHDGNGLHGKSSLNRIVDR